MAKPDWVDGFIEWHESVIAQYSAEVQAELRLNRRYWLGGIAKRQVK